VTHQAREPVTPAERWQERVEEMLTRAGQPQTPFPWPTVSIELAAEDEPVQNFSLGYTERAAIGWRVEDEMGPLRTLEQAEKQQEVIDLTAFAEVFRRWVEAGCPQTKGGKA
jgi:hypothetical protein